MSRPAFSLGLIADCQYADVDAFVEEASVSAHPPMRRFYRRSLSKLEAAIDTFNRRGVHAIVNVGDLIDRRLDDTAPVMEILRSANAPVWSIAGNHDFADDIAPPSTVYSALGMPSPYYARSIGDYRMLFLDTNELGVIKHPADTPEYRRGTAYLDDMRATGRPNAFSWNGGVGQEQLRWMWDQCAEAHRHAQKVVLFMHHPFFPSDDAHNMLNDREFGKTVQGIPNVVMSISGHNHHGNYGVVDGVHCLTLHGMVEHESNSFSIAHFFTRRIEIEGFGREPSRAMPLKG